jgi:hypothetical protein
MRSLILTALLIICFSSLNYGQISFGAKVGPNLSTLKVTPADHLMFNYKPHVGAHIGLVMDEYFDDWISFRTEFLYNLKGASYKNDVNGTEGECYTHNVSVPVLLSFRPSNKTIFNVGSEVSYMFYNTKGINQKGKGLDFGLAGGFAYMLNDFIQLEMRYTHGLTVISRNRIMSAEGKGIGIADTRSNYLQLSLAYFLH